MRDKKLLKIAQQLQRKEAKSATGWKDQSLLFIRTTRALAYLQMAQEQLNPYGEQEVIKKHLLSLIQMQKDLEQIASKTVTITG